MSLDAFIAKIEQAARAGGASEFDIATLRELVLHRREFETLLQAAKIGELERSLSEMNPGERRDAICERTGLSRRRFYELKQIASAAPDRTGSR